MPRPTTADLCRDQRPEWSETCCRVVETSCSPCGASSGRGQTQRKGNRMWSQGQGSGGGQSLTSAASAEPLGTSFRLVRTFPSPDHRQGPSIDDISHHLSRCLHPPCNWDHLRTAPYPAGLGRFMPTTAVTATHGHCAIRPAPSPCGVCPRSCYGSPTKAAPRRAAVLQLKGPVAWFRAG